MKHYLITAVLAAALVAGLAPTASADTECYERVLCTHHDTSTWGEGECGDAAGEFFVESHNVVAHSPMVPGAQVQSYNGCAAYDDGSTAYTWSWLYATGSYASPIAGFYYVTGGWTGGTGATGHCYVYYYTYLGPLSGSGYGRDCGVLGTYAEPPVVASYLP